MITDVVGSADDAKRVLTALEAAGWVCVPREPTQQMLDAAYWSALAENAAGVWEDMLETCQSGTGQGGSV